MPAIHIAATAVFISGVPHPPPRCARLTDGLRFECDYPSQVLDIVIRNRQRCLGKGTRESIQDNSLDANVDV
jgi:hypothetical protein